jgi:hypothetical protein
MLGLIDGPLLPEGAATRAERHCERIFIRGAFQKRCKPGLSHFGAGLQLRTAARKTAEQFRDLAAITSLPHIAPRVISRAPIVEAFPNAYIGVMLPDAAFALSQALKRKKFDWLYDNSVRERVFVEC